MARKFDVVIFGASGYTGKYVTREAINLLNGYKWAIAGRNEKKLMEALKEVEIFTNKVLSDVSTIIADINDEKSLVDMTKQTKVLINCCGPYRFYGEPVIKACIETSTSHLDVSGEPQYMETMQLKYHEVAQEKGIFIVTGCGYDSIPADMGTVYLQRNFQGTVNSIIIYTKTHFLNNYQAKGAGVNFTTYESAVHGLANINELKAVRKELFKERLPNLQPKIKKYPVIHKAAEVDKKWSLSIPAADFQS